MNCSVCFRCLVFIPTVFAAVNISYIWPRAQNIFDFIVGIAVNDRPVGIGTLIKNNLVVTSANCLEMFYKKSKTDDTYAAEVEKAEIFAIDEVYNKSKTLTINEIKVNYAKRNKVWIKMGFQKNHSPIHDLILITIGEEVKNKSDVKGKKREAFAMPGEFIRQFARGWTFAGFGYVDRFHIALNTDLEITTYEDSSIADCDEWIPRPWGRFVCLLNVQELVGVSSGAPLFHNGTLRGIGCFSLTKGKESILVFTDLKEYEYVFEEDDV